MSHKQTASALFQEQFGWNLGTLLEMGTSPATLPNIYLDALRTIINRFADRLRERGLEVQETWVEADKAWIATIVSRNELHGLPPSLWGETDPIRENALFLVLRGFQHTMEVVLLSGGPERLIARGPGTDMVPLVELEGSETVLGFSLRGLRGNGHFLEPNALYGLKHTTHGELNQDGYPNNFRPSWPALGHRPPPVVFEPEEEAA